MKAVLQSFPRQLHQLSQAFAAVYDPNFKSKLAPNNSQLFEYFEFE